MSSLSSAPFGRVVTAMVTPFAADGSVDLPLAARLAQHLVANGSDGLVVCGTTGESPTLSWDEQLALIKTVLDAVGEKVPVLAGTGSNSTAEAVEATREAAALGAHGALVVVPYYNRPPQEGLEAQGPRLPQQRRHDRRQVARRGGLRVDRLCRGSGGGGRRT